MKVKGIRRVAGAVAFGWCISALGGCTELRDAVSARLPAPAAPNASNPIEFAYFQPGTQETIVEFLNDEAGRPYTVVRPANSRRDGRGAPILAWAYGTEGEQSDVPAQYCVTARRPIPPPCEQVFDPGMPVLKHFASWAFIVVASESGRTGDGRSVWGSVQDVIHRNSNPASPLYHRVDTTKVGVAGHSQGALGAFNAAIASDGVITSIATVELPNPIVPIIGGFPVEVPRVTQPKFLLSVTGDGGVSPEWSNQAWFDVLPGAVVKAQLKFESNSGVFAGYHDLIRTGIGGCS